jgi:hypothetical protein
MWVAIHKCMEAKLGISLYSYLYPKLAKIICLSYYLLCFPFYKIREQEGRICSRSLREDGGKVAQTMYTHVSKCKNDKKKMHPSLGLITSTKKRERERKEGREEEKRKRRRKGGRKEDGRKGKREGGKEKKHPLKILKMTEMSVRRLFGQR